MNVEQMKLVLCEMLAKTDLTACLVGHRGVGKSAGVMQACRELGWRYVALRLGQMEVGDLVGIPYREGSLMHWSRPAWWPGDDDPPTVIHCDELNRAQQEDTLQAIFQFVEPPLEGRGRALHTHRLAAQHKVVVSINPPDGSYQVATLDRALLDRMVMLYVETDPACWGRYAAARRLDEEVRGFIAANPQLLARAGSPVDMQMEPTERAWEMVSTLRRHCRLSQELEMEVYAGIVGHEAALTFMAWCGDRSERPLRAAEILERWPEVAARAAAQRDDQQAATIADLNAQLAGVSGLDEATAEHLVAYIALLPRDLRFALVKSLLRLPAIAAILAQDRFDGVILEALTALEQDVR